MKHIVIEGLGPITLRKRRGSRSIRLRITAEGVVEVSLPAWLPYQSGLDFAMSRKEWIKKHQVTPSILAHKQRIGRSHRLLFVPSRISQPTASVRANLVTVKHPANHSTDSSVVQTAAKRAALRALKKESQILLPQRVEQLAHLHGLMYASLQFKAMRGRWGSCSANRALVFNTYLIQLPWDLIDYVIVHELSHTIELNHSPLFWQTVENILIDYKDRKARLKTYRPVLIQL